MDRPGRPLPTRATRRQALAGLFGSAWVAAAGAAPPARAPDVLRYGGDAALAPFESLDAQGRPQGFQVELLAALGREIGADIRIQLSPWADTEAAFRTGALDLVAMVDTPQRRQWAQFAHGHATPALGVYQRRAEPEPPDLASLTDRRLAVLDSPALHDTLQTVRSGLRAQFDPYPDAAQALAAVQQGRADLALLPRAHADPVLAQRVTNALRSSRLALQIEPYALAVAPGNRLLLARVQRGLHALERSGDLQTLRQRWLGNHRDLAPVQRQAPGPQRQPGWIWGVAGVAASGVGLMAWKLRQRSRRVTG